MKKRVSAGAGIALSTAFLFLAGAVATVLLVGHLMHREAVRQAEAQARSMLERNLATHKYFTEQLKPSVFRILDRTAVAPSYFDPTWMSSTYAVREIDKYSRSPEAKGYYYKECAINARSPANEADDFEREFVLSLNRDPTLQQWSGIREVEGKSYLVLLQRGETMQEVCLRCHSSPDRAPKDLPARYGPTRSFGRRIGEVVSAISIRVPLADAYRSTRHISFQLSAALVGLLLLVLGAQWWRMRRLVVEPLAELRRKAVQISADETHLGETIEPRGAPDIAELSLAFNTMSESLRRDRDHLEDLVEARSAELRRVNQELERDIERRKRIEEELEAARAEADSANQAKGRFLANMSHEIRTPLNGVIGMLDLSLASDPSLDQREYLEMAQASARSLLGIVNDILDYSKIEAGRMELEEAPFGLRAMLESRLRPLTLQAGQKGLSLDLEVDAGVPEIVIGDPGRLTQIVGNLVGNAIKFTEAGQVRVGVAAFGGCDGVAWIRVSVADSGIGIPRGKLGLLFDSFTQADSSTCRRYGGTGLGLAISRELVELMGGEISVESEPGKGSVFTFTAPLRLPESANLGVGGPEAGV